MTTLVRAELLKLRTTRAAPALLALSLAIALARMAAVFLNAGKIDAFSLGTTASNRDLLLAPASAALLLLILGVLCVSGEVRHATIEWSFLHTPLRRRVLLAKALTIAMLTAGYAIVSSALVVGVSAALLAQRGVPLDLANAELLLAASGSLLGLPLFGVLGVGLGAVVRNHLAAVIVPLLWFLVVESLLPAYGLAGLARWLPGGATAALARAEAPGVLPMWLGALLLGGYAAAALVWGIVLLGRRDLS